MQLKLESNVYGMTLMLTKRVEKEIYFCFIWTEVIELKLEANFDFKN